MKYTNVYSCENSHLLSLNDSLGTWRGKLNVRRVESTRLTFHKIITHINIFNCIILIQIYWKIIMLVPIALKYIALGKKKCRICDRNLTLYLTYLELSDLSQIWAVLFANLLSFRRQRHYPPPIKNPLLICKKLRQPVFTSLFWSQLSITESVLHGPEEVVITWCEVWTIRRVG